MSKLIGLGIILAWIGFWLWVMKYEEQKEETKEVKNQLMKAEKELKVLRSKQK